MLPPINRGGTLPSRMGRSAVHPIAILHDSQSQDKESDYEGRCDVRAGSEIRSFSKSGEDRQNYSNNDFDADQIAETTEVQTKIHSIKKGQSESPSGLTPPVSAPFFNIDKTK